MIWNSKAEDFKCSSLSSFKSKLKEYLINNIINEFCLCPKTNYWYLLQSVEEQCNCMCILYDVNFLIFICCIQRFCASLALIVTDSELY